MNTVQPKECPFCKSGLNFVMDTIAGHWVRCSACGATGPNAKNREEAIDKWNKAPREENDEP